MPGARIKRGERVTLRTCEREDVPFLQRSVNPEVRYQLGNPIRNREQFEDRIENDNWDRILVCLDGAEVGPGQPNGEDTHPIGMISIQDADWKRPELGYWLVPEVHGEGYGKESVSLVIEYVFREHDTPAVGAVAFDFNDASRGLLESLGFSEEGRQRKFMFVNGEHRDLIQYGLLREEWQGGQ